jgi:hypothetical protein
MNRRGGPRTDSRRVDRGDSVRRLAAGPHLDPTRAEEGDAAGPAFDPLDPKPELVHEAMMPPAEAHEVPSLVSPPRDHGTT